MCASGYELRKRNIVTLVCLELGRGLFFISLLKLSFILDIFLYKTNREKLSFCERACDREVVKVVMALKIIYY